MMRLRVAVVLVGATRGALAACPTPPPDRVAMPTDDVGCHVVDAFSGSALWLHGAAVASTVALSASGLDHTGRRAFDAPSWRGFADRMVLAGWVGPPLLGLGTWSAGVATSHRRVASTGAAALQAITLTFAATVVLKVGTGRPYPLHGYARDDQTSRDHPEFSREWGPPSRTRTAWPSGHTSVAFSFAASVAAVNVDQPVVGVASYAAASAIGVGMLAGVHHFPSDVLAGALMGQAIGWNVGRGFRGARSGDVAAVVVPWPVDGGAGVALRGVF